jgi:uracil-DNA glycosylase
MQYAIPPGSKPDTARAYSDGEVYAHTTGPRDAKLVIVGEAWGADEAAARLPFVGASGKELDRILVDAGLSRAQVLCTNLVDARPPGNDFNAFIYPTSGAKKGDLTHGVFARQSLVDGLHKLRELIRRTNPSLVVAAGNWPLWAFCSEAEVSNTAGYRTPKGIGKWRGSQLFADPSRAGGGCIAHRLHSLGATSESAQLPVLPIYHPAAILREWGWRTITCHDLRARAKRLLDGKASWTAPAHNFIPKPTKEALEAFLDKIERRLHLGAVWLTVDLETYRRRFVSVVGLADEETAIAIPLLYSVKGAIQNYWDQKTETYLWGKLRLILEHPNVRIIGQNFIYDTQWFHRIYNINTRVTFDTMVAHHLLFPGTPKALDNLASLYCDHYTYWKDESGDWENFPDDATRYWLYNCKDTRATYDIALTLREAIKQEGVEELYAFQMKQWTLSRKMMLEGMDFDVNLQKEMRLQLLTEVNKLSSFLLNVVPESWRYTSTGKPWYDSPKGTMDLFYTALGLPRQEHKKTKQPTINAEALAALRDHPRASWLTPVLEALEELRSAGVFISHFLDARVSPDNKIRCTFNIAHPETFRWSSSANGFGEGTNLQNVPKGDE